MSTFAVRQAGSDDVHSFRRDRALGTLSAAAPPVAVGDEPSALAVDTSGRFVYVASRSTGEVRAFRVDATTGALTGIGTPVLAGSLPAGMVVLGP